MKSVLLIGLGRFGRHIASKLNKLGHQVMAVDSDEERVQAVLPYVTNAQIGDSTSWEFLDSLGVRNYDACIVAIGDDFQNSLETGVAFKRAGRQKGNCQSGHRRSRKIPSAEWRRRGGLSGKTAGVLDRGQMHSDHILDYIELDKEYSIFELAIPEEWRGKTILQLDIRKRYGINILGVRGKNGLNMNITPETVFKSGRIHFSPGTAEGDPEMLSYRIKREGERDERDDHAGGNPGRIFRRVRYGETTDAVHPLGRRRKKNKDNLAVKRNPGQKLENPTKR